MGMILLMIVMVHIWLWCLMIEYNKYKMQNEKSFDGKVGFILWTSLYVGPVARILLPDFATKFLSSESRNSPSIDYLYKSTKTLHYQNRCNNKGNTIILALELLWGTFQLLSSSHWEKRHANEGPAVSSEWLTGRWLPARLMVATSC